MKKFFFAVLCLCLTGCGTFNFNVKVVQPTAQTLPTAIASPTAQGIPTATAFVPLPTTTRAPTQPFSLANIQMTDPSHGWAVDALGDIVTTSSSGSIWVNVTPSEETFDHHSLFAWNDRVAWVASSQLQISHVVWRTLDGGDNWKASQPIPLGAGTYTPLRLQFPDINNGWMLLLAENEGQSSQLLLYTSKNGGQDWAQINTISTGMALSYLPITSTNLAFFDGERGWLGGDWAQGEWLMLKTGDGGKIWGTDAFRLPTQQKGVTCDGQPVAEMEPGSMAVDVTCTKEKDAKYLFHHIYYLSKKTGPTWQSWAIPGKLLSMDFLNIHQGWMLVGSDDPQSNKILSTRDGGETWKTLSKVAWKQAQLDFVTDKIGWAIVENGFGPVLFRTEDSGKTWIQVRPSLQP